MLANRPKFWWVIALFNFSSVFLCFHLSPARGKIFSTVNRVPLHTAFHYQPLIILIGLKYCWKGCKIGSHPSSHLCFWLVTINRQTSNDSGILCQDWNHMMFHWYWQTLYDYGILCQDYGILWGLPIWPPSVYIHWIWPKRVGITTALDQNVRAMHSCNSWLPSIV